MQVLKLTLAVLLIGISALFSLRFYGLGQKYQAYDHPILKLPTPWIIAWGGDQQKGPSHSQTAVKGALELPGIMVGVNIQVSANHHFFAVPPRESGGSGPKWLELQDSEIQKIDLGQGQTPMTLEEVLNLVGPRPILLWINDNVENIDLRLEPILRKFQGKAAILIHSEFDVVTKSIKKLLPQLLYGTGVGQRIRLLMLSSLWLEPASPIDGDILVSPLKQQGVSVVSPEMQAEVERRQKVFILGPLNDARANEEALLLHPAGYLTAYPQDLKNKLRDFIPAIDSL